MTYMELIEIISTLLIFGSGLLLVVVVVSFLLSKVKGEENPGHNGSHKLYAEPVFVKQSLNREQQMIRKKQSTPVPHIYQLDQFKPHEVKTIRKINSSERLSDEKYYAREIAKTKTRRYTIVNDQLKKSSHKAMNFYF